MAFLDGISSGFDFVFWLLGTVTGAALGVFAFVLFVVFLLGVAFVIRDLLSGATLIESLRRQIGRE